jgi:hypothetical protein
MWRKYTVKDYPIHYPALSLLMDHDPFWIAPVRRFFAGTMRYGSKAFRLNILTTRRSRIIPGDGISPYTKNSRNQPFPSVCD